MLTNTFKTQVNRCFDCGAKLDACTAVHDDQVPQEGGLSVCGRCGGLGFFTADLAIRRPTPKEAFELAASFEVQRIVSIIRRHRAN